MNNQLSANTKAILLLTAPLIVGRREASERPLSTGEYRRFARWLWEKRRQPADLLDRGAGKILGECRFDLDGARLERLIHRGFLLSQAVERWQARAIWVVSRADAGYPQRLKKRLGDDAPPVLYGCGDDAILNTGGLAVVGSRHVDDVLIEYTEGVGGLAASARRTLVSGGARGIDQAAMRGALEGGGRAVGILANGLEKAALMREHRRVLMDKRLALISPYDPSAPFHVGHAMQRNKLIYALADAALVVSSDHGKGGTWTGAVEQLGSLKLVPVYTRATGEVEEGLRALRQRGARAWPDPRTPDELVRLLDEPVPPALEASGQIDLLAGLGQVSKAPRIGDPEAITPSPLQQSPLAATPASELFTKVRQVLEGMDGPKTDAEIAEDLEVSKSQVRVWLRRLVEEGRLEKLSRPVRYCPTRLLA